MASSVPSFEPELAARLLDALRGQLDAMVDLLEALVRAQSPSHDSAAQAAVFAILAEALEALGFEVRRLSGRETGGQLYARPRARPRGFPLQLLLGHSDTVWPEQHLARGSLQSADGRMHGPGVYDMKGGLVQMLFALRALAREGAALPATPLVFINSDEEIRSFESRNRIRRLARAVDRVLVLEPSLGIEGRLKTTRKGVGWFSITVQGRSAHAGLDPEKGISAILELSHVIQDLFALNDADRGVAVNVGRIEGGLRPNVVAPESRAEVDVRVRTRADANRIEAAIRALEPRNPEVRLRVEGGFGRPPMEPTPGNRRLWTLAHGCARQLGFELGEGSAGGASDGNLTSPHVPTLDGLGAVGDGAHAEHEFVFAERMPERAALLALLLLAPV